VAFYCCAFMQGVHHINRLVILECCFSSAPLHCISSQASLNSFNMTISQDQKTQFLYLKGLDLYTREKPFQVFLDIPKESPDQRKSNLVYEDGPTEVVHDVRGHESEFSIDTNGFTFIKHQSKLSNEQFEDTRAVEDIYLPECLNLLKENLDGVDRVHFFDWRASALPRMLEWSC
jgi:hypothetical protein